MSPGPHGTPDWFVYTLRLPGPAPIPLSEEHDRFLWAAAHEVAALVWGERVRAPLLAVAAAASAAAEGRHRGRLP